MKSGTGERRRYRIAVLFAAAFVLMMAGTIALCWLLNSRFLEEYYRSGQKKLLFRLYDTLASSEDRIESEEMDEMLQEAVTSENVGIVIIDSNAENLQIYATNRENIYRRLWANILDRTPLLEDRTDDTLAQGEGDRYYIRSREQETETSTFQIVRDTFTDTDSMELFGTLPGGHFVLLRTPLESIARSSRVANRFLIYTGLCTVLIGAAAAYFLARRLTGPIRELVMISRHMKELDFSDTFHGSRTRELTELGDDLQELGQSLEHTLSELKTANTELKRDLARREEMEEMRRDFISGVTHELKTPLALIRGYAEGLSEGIIDDPQGRSEYCGVILDEADRMNRMVAGLLSLNELEFGQRKAEMEHFDLADLLRGHLESIRILADRDGIRLQQDIPGSLMVWGDPMLVEEVVDNYLSNALHHAAGDKVIEVSAVREDGHVRTTVFNTGSPIPADAFPHIWETFYKVDKARTRAYGGSGVGLSVVKAVMELHGQKYGAVNYDNGVAFWFELETG